MPPSLKNELGGRVLFTQAPQNRAKHITGPARWDTDNDIAGTSYLEISDAIFDIRFLREE